jgi:hypothetical protein
VRSPDLLARTRLERLQRAGPAVTARGAESRAESEPKEEREERELAMRLFAGQLEETRGEERAGIEPATHLLSKQDEDALKKGRLCRPV